MPVAPFSLKCNRLARVFAGSALLGFALLLIPGPAVAQPADYPAGHIFNWRPWVNRKDTTAIKVLYRRSRQLIPGNPDSAMLLFQRGLAWSRQLDYSYGQVMNLLGIARIEEQRGKPERALAWFRQALPVCRKAEETDIWGNYYLYGTWLYNITGYKDTAIAYAHKVLDITGRYPERDSAEMISGAAYTYLGMIYMGAGENPLLAVSYYEKALQIARRNGSREQLPQLYAGLGGAWANNNNSDSSTSSGYRKGLAFYFKSAALAEELKDDAAQVNAYQNISGIYNNLDRPDSSELYLKKLFRFPDKYISYHSRIAARFILAAGFHRKKDYPKAIRYYNEARDLAHAHQSSDRLTDIEYNLFEVYKATGKYVKALEHLEAYSGLRDSFLDKEKIQATQRLEVRFRTAEKDKALALNRLKLNTQQNLLREKNIWIGAGGISTLLLAGLMLVWRRNSQHRRLRQEEQLRLLEKEQQLWKQGEEIRNLNAMVKGEEKERERLGRELHDGIVSQLAAVKMNLDTLQLKYPVPEAEHRQVLEHLDDIVTDLRKTAHNLIPGILLDHGLVPALEAYCEKTAGFTGLDIAFVHQDLIPRMHTDFELSLYRMVQELVQNVVKHAAASRVLVQVDYHAPMLILTVEDNGRGITPEKLSAEGIGLNNLQSRVKALQGHVDIRGRKNKGTSVYLEFDLSLMQSLMST